MKNFLKILMIGLFLLSVAVATVKAGSFENNFAKTKAVTQGEAAQVNITYYDFDNLMPESARLGLVFSGILGVIAVFLMLLLYYTGFLWLTAYDKSPKRKKILWRLLATESVSIMVVLCLYFIVTIFVKISY